MSPRTRLRALWCLRVRPLLRRALGVPALDHATTFERRIAALEALVARLVERDAIDAADIATALRETVDGLTRQWPMAGGGETWAPTYGDLLAALDRTAEIRRARNGAADRGTT